MKYYIVLLFIIVSFSGVSQPNPQERYPARIQAITEQLKIDSLNYKLIWERLKMKVNLMGGFETFDQVFSLKVDSIDKRERREHYFDEFNTDFQKIFNNVIKEKRCGIYEESDYYLNQIWFYSNMLEIDRAIESAKYLRDLASNSSSWKIQDYYGSWALYSLYTLYVINNQYEEALKTIETMLQKKRDTNPKVLYAGGGDFLGFQDKIRLFEHFNKNDRIIPFLKKTCLEYFNWYFENINNKEKYYIKSSKENGFHFLKLIINYMNKNKDGEYSKFNENFDTINPNLSDEKLKNIIMELLK